MYPNFDDDSDEIDYGYSEQIDDDIDSESVDEDFSDDLESVDVTSNYDLIDRKFAKKDAKAEFMQLFKNPEIIRVHRIDGGDEYNSYYYMFPYFFILAYTEIIAGAPSQSSDFYNISGQIKELLDKMFVVDGLFDNMSQYVVQDLEYGDLSFDKYYYERYHLYETVDSNFGTPCRVDPTTTPTLKLFSSIEDLFEFHYKFVEKEVVSGKSIVTNPYASSEVYDEEPSDEEPSDEDTTDEDTYSEQLWALEPGYYMSYYANLGFIIPNRYAIDVLIADRIYKYGFLPIVQVTLPLELNWMPEMAQLIALGTSLAKGFLGSQQSQIVSSATITKPASQYLITYYPSRATHTLASAMEAAGGNFNLSTFIKGPSGLNPMIYSIGIHIEDIVGKVARCFSTVWLLPMKDYIGFNREDSVPEPNYGAIGDLKHYIRGALIKENLVSFNKIEIYDPELVERSNLGPKIDNIMSFDNWIKVRESMNRYIDSLKVNAYGFGRIFDQMVRNWKIWNVPTNSKLTKHADFFERSGPYENSFIWGHMQGWAQGHYIDESIKGSSKSTILWQ